MSGGQRLAPAGWTPDKGVRIRVGNLYKLAWDRFIWLAIRRAKDL
jgi:hypothetical protein